MQDNTWDVPYSTICFVERALCGHTKIARCVRTKDTVFRIELMNEKTIHMLLVHEYNLSVATIQWAQAKFPEVDYIVTSMDWFGYTKDAKQYGKNNDLGIFTFREFMGALHRKNPKTYFKKDK